MELSNEFTVDVPVDRAWEVLTDVPTIAPCLPGAQLQEVEGDEYRGIVKVKVGPITAQYKGKATFVESDELARRAVIRAEGRETRGQGNASALITAEMHSEGERTRVKVSTDLTVTGKVAQFGRGVMADVSAKLMDQFADNLKSTVLADAAAGAPGEPGEPGAPVAVDADAPPQVAGSTGAAADAADVVDTAGTAVSGVEPVSTNGSHAGAGVDADADDRPRVRTFDLPEPEPVDLLDAAGTPVLRRILPVVGIAVVLLVVIRIVLRRRRG